MKRRSIWAGARNVKVFAAMAVLALLIGAFGLSLFAALPRYVAPVRVKLENRPRNDRIVQAAADGDLPAVKRMLDGGASPNSIADFGDEYVGLLSTASGAQGSEPMVRMLLDRGADVNGPDFWGGNAATSAAVAGNPEALRLLVDHGADVNADDDGANALAYAENQLREAKGENERRRYATTFAILRKAGARPSLFPFIW
ncbi:MAG TPA: ankyrin repeat domain-containing protein [Fimbriimonadaceae bacterium]|nr:ankyrin repeat domain-containing protein [Fimbriimonadaceae bacterium]